MSTANAVSGIMENAQLCQIQISDMGSVHSVKARLTVKIFMIKERLNMIEVEELVRLRILENDVEHLHRFLDKERINGIRQAEALAWGNKRERRIL